MEELDDSLSDTPPVWAIFGDLMSGLVGVFVLLLVWALGFQFELAQSLENEVKKRQAEEQRRMALEEALADPLATGRVTLRDGRIVSVAACCFLIIPISFNRKVKNYCAHWSALFKSISVIEMSY